MIGCNAANETSRFLSGNEFEHLVALFSDQEIEVRQIPALPDQDLNALGVRTIGARMRLRSAARQWLESQVSRLPYQDNISRGNKPYHRNISRGNIPVWYTFENTQYQQMQPMWFCIFSNRWFEETFEKTQRRKAKQMQPIWLWLFSSRTFKDTFEKKHSGEKSYCCLFVCLLSWPATYYYTSTFWGPIWKHKGGEIFNKCYRCDFVSSYTTFLKAHLTTHSGKSPTNVISVITHTLRQAIWGDMKTNILEDTNKCNQCD